MTIAAESSAVPSDPEASSTGGIGAKELLVMISAIMALMALAIDLLLPAFDDIRETFGLSEDSTQVSQTITVFFLGLAVAQLAWGPLADRFGRKPILYAGIAIYAAGAIASAIAPSMNWLLFARFVWGVGAAGSRVVATAIIRDSFEGTLMAKAMSQIMAVFVMAPIFAPAIGAGLIAIFHWSAVFWFCVVWSGVIMLWTRRLPETLDPENVRPLEFRSIFSGFGVVMRNRVTAGYTLATMFLQGIFTAYLAISELIIGEIFDRKADFPYIFGAVAVMFGVAAVINGRLVVRLGMDRMTASAFAVNLPFAVVLVIVSVAGDGRPPIWLFMSVLAVVLASFMLLMPNLNTAAMTPVGHVAGSASAFTGAMRTAGGAVLAAIATRWVSDSVVPFAVAILVFCSASAITVWIVRRGLAGAEPLAVAS